MFVLTGEDDHLDVRSAVADLAGKWKDFGLSLGIHFSDLDAIPFSSPSDCLRELLALWLKQSYNVRTFPVSFISYTMCTSLPTKESRLEPMKTSPAMKVSAWKVHIKVLGFIRALSQQHM